MIVPAHSTHYITPDWQNLQLPVKIYEDIGNTGTIADSILIANQTTDVKQQTRPGIPRDFTLFQNYPNPFNPSTTISYRLPKTSHVILKIYNMLGQEVAMLVNEEKVAGVYQAQWNASKLPSGLYFYRLTAGAFTDTKKMMLLK